MLATLHTDSYNNIRVIVLTTVTTWVGHYFEIALLSALVYLLAGLRTDHATDFRKIQFDGKMARDTRKNP